MLEEDKKDIQILISNIKASYQDKLANEHNVDEFGISDEDREIVKLVKDVRTELWGGTLCE